MSTERSVDLSWADLLRIRKTLLTCSIEWQSFGAVFRGTIIAWGLDATSAVFILRSVKCRDEHAIFWEMYTSNPFPMVFTKNQVISIVQCNGAITITDEMDEVPGRREYVIS